MHAGHSALPGAKLQDIRLPPAPDGGGDGRYSAPSKKRGTGTGSLNDWGRGKLHAQTAETVSPRSPRSPRSPGADVWTAPVIGVGVALHSPAPLLPGAEAESAAEGSDSGGAEARPVLAEATPRPRTAVLIVRLPGMSMPHGGNSSSASSAGEEDQEDEEEDQQAPVDSGGGRNDGGCDDDRRGDDGHGGNVHHEG